MDMRDTTLVKDRFMIDEELLISLAVKDTEDGYFNRSLTFYENVHDKPMFLTTEKQVKWLMDLEARLQVQHERQMSKLEPPQALRAKATYIPPVHQTTLDRGAEVKPSLAKKIRAVIRTFLYGAP